MIFVIFDTDGTLTNTKKVDDKCFMKAFEETFNLKIYDQKWEDLKHITDWGITEEIILREWNRKPNRKEYNTMITKFINNLKSELRNDLSQFVEVAGAKNFFYEIQQIDHIFVGIATGSWEKSAKIKLEAIEIKLSNIAFSNSNYFMSREDIVQHVIDQLKLKSNATPDKIVYFGDGQWDYRVCKNLEIDFIGIDIMNDHKLKNIGATTVFRNYLDKQSILNEIVF